MTPDPVPPPTQDEIAAVTLIIRQAREWKAKYKTPPDARLTHHWIMQAIGER